MRYNATPMNTLPKIRVWFTGFWPDFNPERNYFINLLRQGYNVELSEKPDFVIYSVLERRIRRFQCPRIFYSGENVRPNFSECDFAFSYDYIDNPDHYRLPLYVLYGNLNDLIRKPEEDINDLACTKVKFCNFVYSNSRHGIGTKKRFDLFQRLSKYKRVDSGGRYANNIGGPVKDKLAFIRDYKFTIAFENSEYPGYTTEKIFEPMQVRSVPIYWGNPLVTRDFNTRSFVNAYDYPNLDSLVEAIISLDKNKEAYKTMLRQPYLNGNTVSNDLEPPSVLRQFDYIFNSKKMMRFQDQSTKFFWFPFIYKKGK